MKILVVPDSFKGSLSSEQVCKIISSGIKAYSNDAQVQTIAFSDGGEGFCECVGKLINAEKIPCRSHDIYMTPIEAYYFASGDTAIVDSAAASGLKKKKHIMVASSYGTGELIKSALDNGYKKIILGLGGTGCCDGGAGAIEALGGRFFDKNQDVICGVRAANLNGIFGVDFRKIPKNVDITFACDVKNQLFGKNGAAYVFAPQKGATDKEVKILDDGLRRLDAFFKKSVADVSGGGAAGGMCAGLYAVLGGRIESGFDIMAKYALLDKKIKSVDIVVTGEGRTDRQTLMGKLPSRICAMAKKFGKRCVVISGSSDGTVIGDKMITLADGAVSTQEAISNAEKILYEKSKMILQ